jgi:hypothetical protein
MELFKLLETALEFMLRAEADLQIYPEAAAQEFRWAQSSLERAKEMVQKSHTNGVILGKGEI